MTEEAKKAILFLITRIYGRSKACSCDTSEVDSWVDVEECKGCQTLQALPGLLFPEEDEDE